MAFHYKKDGSLDMRYSSSKAAMSSGFGGSSFGYSGGANYSPMSFGASPISGLHHKKDGTLDMRYASSRAAAPSVQPSYVNRPPSSSGLHHKKDGTLDMRYASSRAAAPSVQPSYVNRPPSSSGLHHKKDGTLDMRYASSRAAAPSVQPSYVNRPPNSSGLHHKKDGTLDMRYASSRAAASPVQSSYVNQPSSSSGLHHKKDGTLDMRYASSRAVAASVQSGYTNRPPSSSDLHYKKDGTLDMRYGSSRAAAPSAQSGYANRPPNSSDLHYKKDGTLDMRYASSKATTTHNASRRQVSNHGIPSNIPTTKTGIPDMRTTAAKEWVKEQAQNGRDDIPSWIPRIKDGSLDTSKAVTQEYLKWKDTPSTNYDPDQRFAYYCQKLEDMLFRNQVENARQDPVEMPQYEMLPETQEMQQQLCNRPMGNSTRRDDVESSRYERPSETQEIYHQSTSYRQTRSSMRQDDEYDIRSEISESVRSIDYKDLNINPDDKLGQGAFGIVYKAIWNHQTVAVKQLHLNKLTRQEKNSFVKEIKIMSTLGEHPNLVYLHGYILEPPCLVMEYVELGSLNHLLHYCEDSEVEAKITDGRIKKKLVLGTALGMTQLHAYNIVHGDLKPQNVLVSKDYTAKVTDFGLATLRGKTSSSIASSIISDDGAAVCGTAGYMAPELLDTSRPPDYPSDVYSFGVVLNEVIQEEEPYSDQFRNFLGRGPFAAVNYAKLGNRPRINSRTPSFLRNFIEQCWNRDYGSRPTFQKIFKDLQSSQIRFPNSF